MKCVTYGAKSGKKGLWPALILYRVPQQMIFCRSVPDDRILPFGMKENFWEMSATGPCGTCTEIHVALNDEFRSRSDLVNANNPLLCELWNIVFIKYNK